MTEPWERCRLLSFPRKAATSFATAGCTAAAVSTREDRERRMLSHFSGVMKYRIAAESVIKPRCNREVEGVKNVFIH
jgi:hypothetical protein